MNAVTSFTIYEYTTFLEEVNDFGTSVIKL